MKSWKFVKNATHFFFQKGKTFLILFLTLHILINFFIIPALALTAQGILWINKIPYLGYDNFTSIVTKNPLAVLELIALLIIILMLVYLQFAFVFIGIDQLRQDYDQTIWEILKKSWSKIHNLKFSSFPFFICYLIIVVPLSNILLGSPLLDKVKIPTFIEDFFLSNGWMTFIYLAFILIITFLAIRLIQVLPLIFIKNNQITEAIKNSWHNTGPRFWKIIVRFILVILIASLVKFAVIGFIVSFQRLLDLMLEKNIAFYFAIGNLSLIKIIQLLLGIWASALSALIVVVDFYQDEKITNSSLYKNTEIHFKKKLGKGSYTISALIILIISIVNFRNYALFINNHDNTKILEISHRGVDGNNGVQNTIPVLKKTAKLKPDYVEMDIHETKDHQFIVMHDANLKQLTGLNKEPYQLTLKQLTKLKVRENGQSAPMASFDDYYQTARKIHQHLLIEIKTTPHDSKNMLDIFLKKYGRIIVNNHDRVHSLDYRIVDGIKQKAPKIFVSYIMPYNLIFPNTKANAYTMEEATLDESFIFGAKNENKQVYAWTVDDPDDMDRMQFIGVNGIITNELSKLKKSIKTNNKRTTYAHRIWLYAKENSIFDFSTIEN